MNETADPSAAAQTAEGALDRHRKALQPSGRKRHVDPPDLDVYEEAKAEPAKQNRLLLDWLSDDDHRAELFALVNDDAAACSSSRAETPRRASAAISAPATSDPRPSRSTRSSGLSPRGQSSRRFCATTARITRTAFTASSAAAASCWRSIRSRRRRTPRSARRFAMPSANPEALLVRLSHFAVRAASVMSLRAPEFDLAAFAEQSALRFCQKLMGYALRDFRLLETSLHDAYRGLVYQVFGRHFASDPLAIPLARQGMGKLLKRTSELIDAYALNDEDGLKGCKDRAIPPGMIPSLKRLGDLEGDLNGEQRAIVALGAAVGTVGNVQAAACIAVKAMFDDPELWQKARKLIASTRTSHETDNTDEESSWRPTDKTDEESPSLPTKKYGNGKPSSRARSRATRRFPSCRDGASASMGSPATKSCSRSAVAPTTAGRRAATIHSSGACRRAARTTAPAPSSPGRSSSRSCARSCTCLAWPNGSMPRTRASSGSRRPGASSARAIRSCIGAREGWRKRRSTSQCA